MPRNVKQIPYHFQETLMWFIPTSIIVMTFLLLFFSISEQVGNLKVANIAVYTELRALRSTTAKAAQDTPAEVKAVTYLKEHGLIKDFQVRTQKIELAEGRYWQYAFESAYEYKEISKSVITPVPSSIYEPSFLLIRYTTNDYKINEFVDADPKDQGRAFELFPYLTRGAEAIEYNGEVYSGVVIFVDGKLVMLNEFSSNGWPEKTVVTQYLNAVKQSKNLPDDIKQAADNELKSLN
jgi:hypothetical protein